MIVCLCKGVSCGTIRRTIDDGASDVEAVGRACGAGTDCGSCKGEIEELLQDQTHPRARRLSVLPSSRPGHAA